jgi:predicted transcriptional regulator
LISPVLYPKEYLRRIKWKYEVPEFHNSQPALIEVAVGIVSAYLSHNRVQTEDVGKLIACVHQALGGLGLPPEPAAHAFEQPSAAQIKRSVTPDALVSFEDGKPYKALRRHLTMRGLTPAAYRAKYGLPHDYPMTSASYSAQRSELARSSGLGNLRRGAPKATGPDGAVSDAPKRRGRAPKLPRDEISPASL